MKYYRSLLFVPAHKPEWAIKSPKFNPDALILDLEDAVPWSGKDAARHKVPEILEAMRDWPGGMFVRINGWTTGHLVKDVAAILHDRLTGIMLPKIRGPVDVGSLDNLMTELEIERGMPVGKIEILPLWETPYAMRTMYEGMIASPRVKRHGGGFVYSPGGDRDRSVGLINTPGRLEQVYLAGKSVLDARAAGVNQILGGLSTELHDLNIVREMATRSLEFGCSGSMIIHPSHVAVVNEIFSPSKAEIEEAVAILETMHAGVLRGDAAVRLNGKMIDIAMARSALLLLERAHGFGMNVRAIEPAWRDEFR